MVCLMVLPKSMVPPWGQGQEEIIYVYFGRVVFSIYSRPLPLKGEPIA